MGEGRTEWMTRMIDRWNSGDYEGFFDELGPDVEFSPDPSFPDAGTYRGDRFRRWIRDWIATWGDNRFEMLEMTEVDQAILLDGRWHLETRETGREIPLADFTIVVLFADEAAERPRRLSVFFDREEALAAANEAAS